MEMERAIESMVSNEDGALIRASAAVNPIWSELPRGGTRVIVRKP